MRPMMRPTRLSAMARIRLWSRPCRMAVRRLQRLGAAQGSAGMNPHTATPSLLKQADQRVSLPKQALALRAAGLSLQRTPALRGAPSDAIMAGREHNRPRGMRRRFGNRALYRADHYQLHPGWPGHSARAQRRLAEPRLELDLSYQAWA